MTFSAIAGTEQGQRSRARSRAYLPAHLESQATMNGTAGARERAERVAEAADRLNLIRVMPAEAGGSLAGQEKQRQRDLRRARRRRRRDRPLLRLARGAAGPAGRVLERDEPGRGDRRRRRDAGAGRRARLRRGAAAAGEPGLGGGVPGVRRRAGRGLQAARSATGRSGALHVALDRDEAEELRRRHELQRSLGLEAEWLPPRECRELEPGLRPRSTAASTRPARRRSTRGSRSALLAGRSRGPAGS